MLELNNVSYTYPHGQGAGIKNMSLQVAPGELVLCTGRSGCGKSTLIRLLNGLAPHYYKGELEGQVLVAGKCNRERHLAEISQDVGTLFQNPEAQFFALTVEDEVAIALECQGLPEDACKAAAQAALTQVGMADAGGQSVLGLSEGQKQKVALAGLLAQNPRALVLDEPSANLDPESARELAVILQALKAKGMAVLVVDHRLAWLRDVADRVVVMDQGQMVAEGDFSLLEDDDLRLRHGLRAVEWGDPRSELPRFAGKEAATGFAVASLSFAFKGENPLFQNMSAHFPSGQVSALVGHNGCGKTTLAKLAAGMLRSRDGAFVCGGEQLPQRGRARRVGLVLQNADHQLRMDSVRAELADALMGLPRAEAMQRIEHTLATYDLLPLADRHPQSLSGGEKQRLSVAAAMIRRPDVVFLDEPTSGLDGRNMLRMADDLRRAAEAGATVIVITHDLEFMSEACRWQVPLSDISA
ncbi:MAG: ABC transporter ATP-binding protein [Desulfovibrio sp.]|uniref:ABC transporter ATP-binding protein n=1 Tax=Desulfovibrio sp. TaxID=885 RepID=UPI0039E29379